MSLTLGSMLLTAELLLYYQRCSRRVFLDVYGDKTQRDPPNDYLLKLRRDSLLHQRQVLSTHTWHQPDASESEQSEAGTAAHRATRFQGTLSLMRQGVDYIHRGVLLSEITEDFTLLSSPSLLVKQPGQSKFGDWLYLPAEIKLGKRPKLEYQIVSAFDVQVLADVQEAWPESAWIFLRDRGVYEVDLWKLLPQMQDMLKDCLATLRSPQVPEVFIARSRCNLCHWFSQCYSKAQAQQHLSLVPGVTANRYQSLQSINLTTVAALAEQADNDLEHLPGFGREVAQKLIRQAQSILQNRALLAPIAGSESLPSLSSLIADLPTAEIELYFDIEAEPELNLAYLLGVLVVDRRTQTQTFHSLLAEKPEEEAQVWQQFLELVWRYPDAPIFHFCPYEAQTTERLGRLYRTPQSLIQPLLSRFVDLHEQVTRKVTLPVESYALKHIARWIGFNWRDASANGAQAICWYTDWLATQDRSYLEAIARYNEDDCRAMYHLKNWLAEFLQHPFALPEANLEKNAQKIG